MVIQTTFTHVLQYVKNPLDTGIHYANENRDIKIPGYSDPDWAGNLLNSNIHLKLCLL